MVCKKIVGTFFSCTKSIYRNFGGKEEGWGCFPGISLYYFTNRHFILYKEKEELKIHDDYIKLYKEKV